MGPALCATGAGALGGGAGGALGGGAFAGATGGAGGGGIAGSLAGAVGTCANRPGAQNKPKLTPKTVRSAKPKAELPIPAQHR